jgi:hypothetical protein
MPDISLSDAAALLQLKEHAKDLDSNAPIQHLSDLEDLDKICRDATLLANLRKNFNVSTRKAQGILQLPRKTTSLKFFGSPKVTAALTQRPQVCDLFLLFLSCLPM